MPRLSPDAQVIVNILKNVGPQMGGQVPADHVKVLFESHRLWRAAMKELTKAGYVVTNDKGEIALTDAGAALQ